MTFDALRLDAKYALRTLARAPAFTVTAVATIALAVGANVSVFSVLDRLLSGTPPGVSESQSVKRVYQRFTVLLDRQVRTRDAFSFPELRAVTAALPDGIPIAGYANQQVTVGVDESATPMTATYVAGEYFRSLGLRPRIGRFFEGQELRGQDAPPAVVISDAVWAGQFGRNVRALASSIRINGEQFTIIGVAPPSFRGVGRDAADFWIPYSALASGVGHDRLYNTPYDLRLRLIIGGLTARSAPIVAQRVDAALKTLDVVHDPAASVSWQPIGAPLDPQHDLGTFDVLKQLMFAVAAILIIGSANLANLLGVRTIKRMREISIRFALGASRGRLARQLAVETAILALVGGAVALGVGHLGSMALRALLLSGTGWGEPRIGIRIICVVVALSLGVGLSAGLLPILQTRAQRFTHGLRLNSGHAASGSYVHSALLSLQTAGSVTLVSIALLCYESFKNLERIGLGYRIDDTILISALTPNESALLNRAVGMRVREFADQLTRIPDAEYVALSATPPFETVAGAHIYNSTGDSVPPNGNQAPMISAVSPDFFRAAGVRKIEGRYFTDLDRAGTSHVLIVSRLLARNYWPGQSGVGKCLVIGQRSDECRTVVGIVEDVHARAIIEAPTPSVYLPLSQGSGIFSMPRAIIARARPGRERELVSAARVAMGALAASGNQWRLESLSEVTDRELRPWRLTASLFSGLAALALGVAAIGIYGALAYSISQRAREISIRKALGASDRGITFQVLSSGMKPVILGSIFGVSLTLGIGRAASTLLYGVSPHDPLTLLQTVTLILATAIVACLAPTLKAVRLDPMDAMRID